MLKAIFAILFSTLVLLSSGANASTTLKLINHYKEDLKFKIGINPDVLPELSPDFILAKQGEINTSVLNNGKEAYLRGEDASAHFAFFGVDAKTDVVTVHGYMNKGVAFSWNKGKNDAQTIIFCTPEEYQSKQSC